MIGPTDLPVWTPPVHPPLPEGWGYRLRVRTDPHHHYCLAGGGHPEYADPECCICTAHLYNDRTILCEQGQARKWRHYASWMIDRLQQGIPEPMPF